MKLQKIEYKDLNAKAKEIYNFHKAAAVLADYGYNSMWLSNDWNGADFIAVHVDGISNITVQLKGGPFFAKKYRGKNLHIAFFSLSDLYLYPHDEVLDQVESVISDNTWNNKGTYFQTKITKRLELLESYKVPRST
jgi:hypothetical protein